MKHFNMPPDQIAKELLESGLTVEAYQKVQDRRLERLQSWKKLKITALIKNEQDLIKYGNQVLTEMKNITTVILFLLFTSCGYNAIDNSNYVIITDIESGSSTGSNDSMGCYYYVQGHTHLRVQQEAYFFDKCGKFTVGDTIKIVKR